MKTISKWLIFFLVLNVIVFTNQSLKAKLVIDGVITDQEYPQKKVFQNGDYVLNWRIDGEIITFAMKAKTVGWVAVGIDPELKMLNTDIYIGWVTSDAKCELFDTFCSVPVGPHPPDTDQGGTNDILAFNGKDDGTFTTIEFSRKLDTQDAKDKTIPKTGNLKIMVAFGANDEFTLRHVFRTTDEITMDATKHNYVEINVQQAKDLVDKANNFQTLDVSLYWKQGHIPGSINIESKELLLNLDKLDKKKSTLVYSHDDETSILSANLLANNDFKPVFRLLGNYQAWIDAGYPIEKSEEKTIIRFQVGSKTYWIGNTHKEMDSPPVIIDGRTLLPIRYLSEAIGASTEWEAKTRKITVKLNKIVIVLVINQNTAMINGIKKQIDPSNPKVKPIIILGRTMLPLRFVGEELNCSITWDQNKQEITVTYPK